MPPQISDITTLLLPFLKSISFRTSETLLALQTASLPPSLHTRMSNVKILNSAICKKGSMYLYEYVMYKDLQTGPCHSPHLHPAKMPSIGDRLPQNCINISSLKLLSKHTFGSSIYRGPFRVLHAWVKRDPGSRLLRPGRLLFRAPGAAVRWR
jgi:hypothetical protein